METRQFLKKYLIEDIKYLQENNLHFQSIQLLTLSIEFLGALLDGKPLKSEKQSKKRFNLALKHLFNSRYYFLNKDHFLYENLRNQLIHAFSPGSKLLLRTKTSNSNHLETEDNRLVIVSEIFYEDVKKACEKVFFLIDQNKIKHKHISVDIF